MLEHLVRPPRRRCICALVTSQSKADVYVIPSAGPAKVSLTTTRIRGAQRRSVSAGTNLTVTVGVRNNVGELVPNNFLVVVQLVPVREITTLTERGMGIILSVAQLPFRRVTLLLQIAGAIRPQQHEQKQLQSVKL